MSKIPDDEFSTIKSGVNIRIKEMKNGKLSDKESCAIADRMEEIRQRIFHSSEQFPRETETEGVKILREIDNDWKRQMAWILLKLGELEEIKKNISRSVHYLERAVNYYEELPEEYTEHLFFEILEVNKIANSLAIMGYDNKNYKTMIDDWIAKKVVKCLKKSAEILSFCPWKSVDIN